MNRHESPKSILLICLRYLGDSLLLRPVIRSLHRAHPGVRITALVSEGTGVALAECEGLGTLLEWPRRSAFRMTTLTMHLVWNRYDICFDFTGNDRTGLLSLVSGARRRIAYERRNLPRISIRRWAYNERPQHEKPKPHVLRQRLNLLSLSGIPDTSGDYGLKPHPGAAARVAELTRHLSGQRLHLHATSRDLQKAFPSNTIAKIARIAIESGYSVVATAGPAAPESDFLRAAMEGFDPMHVAIFSTLSWHELVALTASADRFIGCDSAPAHLAAALRIPRLVVFGPSNPDHWASPDPECQNILLPCACRIDKRPHCEPGKPGHCLENLDLSLVLNWLTQRSEGTLFEL